jgi:Zinc finger, C3HC4 type (RING finger)
MVRCMCCRCVFVHCLIVYRQTPSSIAENTEVCCPICRDRLKNPLASKCGHVCCAECWGEWLVEKRECPVCRKRTRSAQLQRLNFLVSE